MGPRGQDLAVWAMDERAIGAKEERLETARESCTVAAVWALRGGKLSRPVRAFALHRTASWTAVLGAVMVKDS